MRWDERILIPSAIYPGEWKFPRDKSQKKEGNLSNSQCALSANELRPT